MKTPPEKTTHKRHSQRNLKPRSTDSGRPRLGVWIGGAAALLLAGIGIAPRVLASKRLNAEVKEEANMPPSVSVIALKRTTKSEDLTLPSTLQAVQETSVSARSAGYLAKRFVDIGSKVKAGQVLATVESPEVDQQLSQAQAEETRSTASGEEAIADVSRLQAAVTSAIAQASSADSTVEEARAEAIHMKSKRIEAKGAVAEAAAKLEQAKQDLEGKKANLVRANSRLNLAKKTYDRWKQLAKGGAVSGQDLDEAEEGFETNGSAVTGAQADVDSAKADVIAAESSLQARKGDESAALADVTSAEQKIQAAKQTANSIRDNVSAARAAVEAGKAGVHAAQAGMESSRANVSRMTALRSFENVIAPFEGTITSRNIEVGDLISPPTGGSQTHDQTNPVSTAGLFGLARTDSLIGAVNVPESYAIGIREGMSAAVTLSEYPGRMFAGYVLHASGAIDASSRTELIEVKIPNQSGLLKPGMYAQIGFKGGAAGAAVQIPATAMIFDSLGTRVAELTMQDTVHFVQVTPGRDLGDSVEIQTGLTGNEKIIDNPDTTLTEGEKVEVASSPEGESK